MAISPHRRVRRLRVPLLVPLLAGLLIALTAGLVATPASAATGYRYWNYFHVQDGHYVFAKTGAGAYTPKNGAVEAYRYGTATTSKGLPPRADLSKYDFSTICKGTKTSPGQKRVAVIIDYGTEADAPSGQTPPTPRTACAAVPTNANGLQVLEAVAQVRVHSYTCGIDGYPANGCSVTVKNATDSTGQPVPFALPKAAAPGQPDASQSNGSGGTGPWPWAALGVICAGLAMGAYAMNRRR